MCEHNDYVPPLPIKDYQQTSFGLKQIGMNMTKSLYVENSRFVNRIHRKIAKTAMKVLCGGLQQKFIGVRSYKRLHGEKGWYGTKRG
jgi:hypothetical protein